MQFPWQKSRDGQLDLLDEASVPNSLSHAASPHPRASELAPTPTVSSRPTSTASAASGRPLQVAIFLLYEDPDNARTEFAEENIDDLAQDIRERGILQPIVVHPADAAGRYRIHFGALRLRAARKAGLRDVPVVVRDLAADPYAQVAENLKRHALSPIEIARFIKGRIDAGESNVTIAKRIQPLRRSFITMSLSQSSVSATSIRKLRSWIRWRSLCCSTADYCSQTTKSICDACVRSTRWRRGSSARELRIRT